MHASIKESPNPEAKILLEVGEEIEQLLRAKGFDPAHVEATIEDTTEEYVLYSHTLLEIPEACLLFSYVLPHSADADVGPSTHIALELIEKEQCDGPRLIMNCFCREKKFELDRSDTQMTEEETSAADRMEDRLLQIAHKQGCENLWSLPETVGIRMIQEIIAYAKRSKRREERPKRRKLRPTK